MARRYRSDSAVVTFVVRDDHQGRGIATLLLEHLASAAREQGITRFVADSTRFYMEFHDEYQGIQGCVINDPLALALTFAPDLVETQPLHVTVDLHSELSLGKTMADFYKMWAKPPNMQVALKVQPRRFIELFIERIEMLVQNLG